MVVLTIIGSGKVGGDAALFSALRGADKDILLLDIVEGLPQGEAMDISHMLSEQGIDADIRGSNDYADMAGSDVVVVVAGVGRKPGMTRMDLLKTNAGIVRSVSGEIKKHAPDSIIIPVTNPLDPIVYVVQKATGFQRERIIGMGNMLDLSRFIQFIHQATNYSRSSIRAMVIGEHGESMLPLPRFSSVAGIPICDMLNETATKELVSQTQKVAAEVIKLKGATVHAPGNAISAIVQAILEDRHRVMPVSAYLNGEYGYTDIAIGVPAEIGREGIADIIELSLNDDERAVFDVGADNIKAAIATL